MAFAVRCTINSDDNYVSHKYCQNTAIERTHTHLTNETSTNYMIQIND